MCWENKESHKISDFFLLTPFSEDFLVLYDEFIEDPKTYQMDVLDTKEVFDCSLAVGEIV